MTNDQTKTLIVVVTLLGGKSPTGVETHFNAILRQAKEMGFETRLITPYTGEKWERALIRLLKNRTHPVARVLYRYGQGWLLGAQLRRLRRSQLNRNVTIYAQCVMSARAAILKSARIPAWKSLMVVHFNQSEASEIVGKGLAAPGSFWCRHLDRLERRFLPRLDGIIFVSEYMREIVNLRVPNLSKVWEKVIFNFPPDPLFPTQPEISGDLITIGTLEPRKNQQYLLQIIAEAKKLGHKFSLSIVGDGPDRRRLQEFAKQLGIENQVTFAGLKPNAAQLISGFRCLAHTSLIENCPITILEGLSYGKPIFAAPVGGIPELYRDGVEGLYCQLSDPKRAANALIKLLSDPALYQHCATAAQIRYETAFAPLPQEWIHTLIVLGREVNALEMYL